jgi:uracil-DNA glycosylase family 4
LGWRDEIRDPNCTLCSLHRSAEYVCLLGDGKRKAKLAIVGEAPGAREDENHRAFVGQAGLLLNEMLEEVGLKRSDFYVTNAAKCRPPDNRTPTRAEVKTCSTTYLARELDAVRPDLVLLLGNSALQACLGRSGITRYRGKVYEAGSLRYFPTFHPAAVLRNPRYGPDVRADLRRFARLARGDDGGDSLRTKVQVVRTKAQLKWLCQQLDEQSVVAWDFETQQRENLKEVGSREWEPDSKIVALSLAWTEGEAVVVPLHHRAGVWKDPDAVLRRLKPHLERRDLKLVAHNGKYDARWAAANGLFLELTFDTMLAAHLLDENRSKALENLAGLYFGVDPWDNITDKSHMFDEPLKRLCLYAGKDADWTLRLYHELKRELQANARLARIFVKLMVPASNSLTKAESIGIYLDRKRTKKMRKLAYETRARVEVKLRKQVPRYARKTINFRSHPQVAHWLFTDLKLPILTYTDGGAPSSKEDVLKRLAKKHKGPALLLEYRGWQKKCEFLDSWLKHADAHSRVHATYKLFGTVTGRISSENPNLQQVPREGPMRTCFGAPQGWKFLEADFAQIELRVAAMVAPEPTLLRIFHTGGDPHLTTSSGLARRTPEDVLASDATGKTEYRKRAKGVNFGFLYGMGEDHFIEYARTNYDFEPTPAEAREYRNKFFRLYPGLIPWHNRQRRLADRYGRVTSPLGRVRHLPDIRSGDRAVRAEAERQAINSPIQSTASDMMLVAMVRLDKLLDPHEAFIVGTVHDQLNFQVRDDAVDKVATIVKETMEDVRVLKKWFGADITVPIEAEIKVGQWWGAGTVWTPK